MTADRDTEGCSPRTRPEILALTGLRGLCALWVCCYHFFNRARPPGVLPWLDLSRGYLAVDIFFMMSGVVLAANYAHLFSHQLQPGTVFNFLRRRAARIYPPYLTFLLVYAAKLLLTDGAISAEHIFGVWNIVGNIALLTGLGAHVQAIVGASWSVSAEMACYLAFPFLAVVLVRAPSIFLLLITAAAAGIGLVMRDGNGLRGGLDVVSTDSLLPIVRAASGFIIGMAVFRLARCSPQDRGTDLLAPLALALLIAGLALSMPDGLLYPDLVLLVFALTKDGPLARRSFGNTPLRGIGLLSYSLYLGHSLFLSTSVRMVRVLTRYAGGDVGLALGLLVYLVAALSLAAAGYLLVERRGHRSLHRSDPHDLDLHWATSRQLPGSGDRR